MRISCGRTAAMQMLQIRVRTVHPIDVRALDVLQHKRHTAEFHRAKLADELLLLRLLLLLLVMMLTVVLLLLRRHMRMQQNMRMRMPGHR